MKSRIKFTVLGNGNIISDITTGNDKIFQGQVAATEYYLYADEMTTDKWLSTDKVYINLTRPDNQTAQIRMERQDGYWLHVSNGWETDCDITDVADLTISFTMRRYSKVDGTTLIATKPTSEVTKIIYPTTGYVPQDIDLHTDYYLAKDNIVEYTPTENFHPSTKKYVDDSQLYKLISTGSIVASGDLEINNLLKAGRHYKILIYGGSVSGSEAIAWLTSSQTANKTSKMYSSLKFSTIEYLNSGVDPSTDMYAHFHGGITSWLDGNNSSTSEIDLSYARWYSSSNHYIRRFFASQDWYYGYQTGYLTDNRTIVQELILSDSPSTEPSFYLHNGNASHALNYKIYESNF